MTSGHSNGLRCLCQVSTCPSCKVIASASRIIQREVRTFNGVLNRIGHTLCQCATSQFVGDRIDNRSPLTIERYSCTLFRSEVLHFGLICEFHLSVNCKCPADEVVGGAAEGECGQVLRSVVGQLNALHCARDVHRAGGTSLAVVEGEGIGDGD